MKPAFIFKTPAAHYVSTNTQRRERTKSFLCSVNIKFSFHFELSIIVMIPKLNRGERNTRNALHSKSDTKPLILAYKKYLLTTKLSYKKDILILKHAKYIILGKYLHQNNRIKTIGTRTRS